MNAVQTVSDQHISGNYRNIVKVCHWSFTEIISVDYSLMMFPVSRRPDNHFLEAICCFPMVYFMAGTIDKYVFHLLKICSFD